MQHTLSRALPTLLAILSCGLPLACNRASGPGGVHVGDLVTWSELAPEKQPRAEGLEFGSTLREEPAPRPLVTHQGVVNRWEGLWLDVRETKPHKALRRIHSSEISNLTVERCFHE